ncbi:MAG: hypothetical protein ACP5I8_16490, partial [Phycisphaerae bacterium]
AFREAVEEAISGYRYASQFIGDPKYSVRMTKRASRWAIRLDELREGLSQRIKNSATDDPVGLKLDGLRQRIFTALSTESTGGAGPVDPEQPFGFRPRAGRMNKQKSESKKMEFLALCSKHKTMMNDLPTAAKSVGISKSTARRWYEDFKNANR